jgi:methanogenic corrinoid protein MtbC1
VDDNMKEVSNANEMIALVADLKEDEALALAQSMLDAGEDPLRILELSQQGLFEVGRRYNQRIYYVSALIMAGEIMRRMSKRLIPLISSSISAADSGMILLGTVMGDIHFIGKDLFKVMARCHGFTVHDLGVDVQPEDFMAAAKDAKPDIVGISCLLDAGYDKMRETIEALKTMYAQNGVMPKFVIGGVVDQRVSDFVGADFWTNDAMQGVKICRQIMNAES